MKLRYKILVCFVAIGSVVLALKAFAGHCAVQRIVTPVYTYQDQIVLKQITPQYYYSVGQELQLDAIAERLAQRIEEKLAVREELRRASVPPANAPQRSLLYQSCAKCHSPGSKAVAQSDAPIFFDDIGTLIATAEQRASMKTAAKLGSMPPPPAQALDDDSYLQIKRDLETASVIAPREPTPAPPEQLPPAPPQPER